MISVNDLKPGNTFKYEGAVYTVLDTLHNKTAMRQMIVKIKAKNIHTGAITDISFTGGDKMEQAHIDKKKMAYLYDDGEALVFMDNETYEQISLPKENLKWEMNFLKESMEVQVTSFEGEVMGIELPTKVVARVVETEPAVRGDTVNKAMKDAKLDTGYVTKVPLFVENNTDIIVRTDTGEYDSRA